MLEHVIHAHFVDRIVGPRPRKPFKVYDLVGAAGGEFVDVGPVGKLSAAAAQVQAHVFSADQKIAGREISRIRRPLVREAQRLRRQ